MKILFIIAFLLLCSPICANQIKDASDNPVPSKSSYETKDAADNPASDREEISGYDQELDDTLDALFGNVPFITSVENW